MAHDTKSTSEYPFWSNQNTVAVDLRVVSLASNVPKADNKRPLGPLKYQEAN